MILPRGEVRYQSLLTAFTDFPGLLEALKSEGFSGMVEIEFPETRGVVFIDSGETINAEVGSTDGSKRIIGQEAIRTLIPLSGQKDGVLNVYRFSPEQVAIVASHLEHEILFQGLSTDFTRLDRLLLKLREERHSGFIEVFSAGHQAMGVLFLEEGEPMEMFSLPESGSSVFGRKSIPLFVENAIKEGAILNIYRSQIKISRAEPIKGTAKQAGEKIKEETGITEAGEGQQELILFFQEILSRVEKLVNGVSRKGAFLSAFKRSLIEKAE